MKVASYKKALYNIVVFHKTSSIYEDSGLSRKESMMALKAKDRFRTISEIFGTISDLLAPAGAEGTIIRVYNASSASPRYVVLFDGYSIPINVYGHEIEPIQDA
jgi:hypothetical protein